MRRALQTLSVALVVDEDTSTVRPHLHASPTPAAASQGDHIRQGHLSLNQLKKLRLTNEEYESIKDNIGFKHLLLSHYRNQLLHWFVPEAMLALSLSFNGSHDVRIGKSVLFTMSYISSRSPPLSQLYIFLLLALLKFKALHVALSCELVLPLKHPDQVSKIMEDP